MVEVTFTLIKKRAGPFVQLAIALAIGWAGMLICKLGHIDGGREYFAGMVAVIFFTIINIVISFAYKSFLRYTVPSYYIYILLVVVLLQSAKLLSGISIWKVEEYKMMIVSITIFYLLGSILVRGIRFIYEIAEND